MTAAALQVEKQASHRRRDASVEEEARTPGL